MLDFSLTFLGLVLIVGLDSTYLSLNRKMYEPIIGQQKIIPMYAILAWLTIVISIQLLVLSRPGITETNTFIYGVLLGFAMYGLYNFTNGAMYSDKWNNQIIVGDIIWGMLLTGTVSFGMFKLKNLMKY